MTLEILTSDMLQPLRHGFFTRKGGESSGVFESLNCGASSADRPEAVALNRGRVAAALGVAADRLATARQVHGTSVAVVAEPPAQPLEADAMVTDRPGLALGVLTADCQPVLFADAGAGIIGAAHAGWRGALDGVLEATLAAMQALGASRDRIRAAIGPTISQAAYEVGPEFVDAFLADDPDNARFFAAGAGDRAQFDLPAYGLMRLRRAGIAEAEWTRHCTYADDDRFYSYRRAVHLNQPDHGRLISAICL